MNLKGQTQSKREQIKQKIDLGSYAECVYGGSGRKGERENELKLKEGHLERVPKIDSRVNGTKVVIEEMKKYLKSKKVIYREG